MPRSAPRCRGGKSRRCGRHVKASERRLRAAAAAPAPARAHDLSRGVQGALRRPEGDASTVTAGRRPRERCELRERSGEVARQQVLGAHAAPPQVHSNPPTLLRVLVAALLVMIGTGFVAAPLGARAPAAQAPATLVDEGTTFFDVGLDNADARGPRGTSRDRGGAATALVSPPIPRVAAPPRPGTWLFRGDASRRRRGCRADRPREHRADGGVRSSRVARRRSRSTTPSPRRASAASVWADPGTPTARLVASRYRTAPGRTAFPR